MPRTHRDFKGVWIPKEIWLAEDLSLYEKALFVEIHSLDNKDGCWASNRHLAKFLGLKERQTRTYISRLEKKKYIKVTVKNRNERVIRVVGKYSRTRDPVLVDPELTEAARERVREDLRRLGIVKNPRQ